MSCTAASHQGDVLASPGLVSAIFTVDSLGCVLNADD